MKSFEKYKPLPKKFYLRDSVTVSRELLGKIIIRKAGNKTMAVKITETEAYIGAHDPACHAFGKMTERNKVMFDTGGKIYVYFIYGNYFCFNIVNGRKGEGNATLIRAGEPVEGTVLMKKYRPGRKNIYELTNGPSKLCMALNIDKSFYGKDVTSCENIFISEPLRKERFEIVTTKRIGLNKGVDFPYRFFIKDNAFVTKHKLNSEIIL